MLNTSSGVRDRLTIKAAKKFRLKKKPITLVANITDIITLRQNMFLIGACRAPLSTSVEAYNRCRKSLYYIG